MHNIYHVSHNLIIKAPEIKKPIMLFIILSKVKLKMRKNMKSLDLVLFHKWMIMG